MKIRGYFMHLCMPRGYAESRSMKPHKLIKCITCSGLTTQCTLFNTKRLHFMMLRMVTLHIYCNVTHVISFNVSKRRLLLLTAIRTVRLLPGRVAACSVHGRLEVPGRVAHIQQYSLKPWVSCTWP